MTEPILFLGAGDGLRVVPFITPCVTQDQGSIGVGAAAGGWWGAALPVHTEVG